jgi:cobalamin synthase
MRSKLRFLALVPVIAILVGALAGTVVLAAERVPESVPVEPTLLHKYQEFFPGLLHG